MPAASLGIESPAWRAGRACVSIGTFLDGGAAADDVLGDLADLGEPPHGWWEVLASVRRARAVVLLLPRPGDPRGLALPRGIVAEAVIGWEAGPVTHVLVPEPTDGWMRMEAPPLAAVPPHPEEALRELRRAVVEAAHTVDDLDLQLESRESDPRVRRDQEAVVDSWVLGPPPLPADARHLAALGLRMLLSLEGARALVDTAPLEYAARGAVESAFSRTFSSR